MCHKNIVGLKNYGFNFSAIGHGAYMVSSNGGSWSNIKTDQNNTIKVSLAWPRLSSSPKEIPYAFESTLRTITSLSREITISMSSITSLFQGMSSTLAFCSIIWTMKLSFCQTISFEGYLVIAQSMYYYLNSTPPSTITYSAITHSH